MLRFRLLGPLEVWEDEIPLQLPSQKVALLLAYLVANRTHFHPREVLAELFWGDKSEERSRNSLRQALYVLKKMRPAPLGQELLLTAGGALRLNPEIGFDLDLELFSSAIDQTQPQTQMDERLAQVLDKALLLYRGPFLSGFYEDWVLQEQLHWQDLFLSGSLQLASHFEQSGQYHRTIEVCRKALAFYPHHEVLSQLLMRAHALTGDRKAAMAQYDELANALSEELSIEPLPETRMLYEQIRDNQLGAHQRVPVVEVFQRFPKGTSFVGRESHLQQILSKARASRAGSILGVVLHGDPGIGKSRILRESLKQLETQGWLCIYAECLPSALSPFEPLIHALQNRIGQPERVLAALPGFARDELLDLIPAWGEPQKASSLAAPDQVQRKRFLAFGLFLEKLSQESPICLAIDDLHWADESTIRFIEFLFRRQRQIPLFWLGCYREESLESGHSLPGVTESLASSGALELIKVGLFSEEESRNLVTSILEDAGIDSENVIRRLISLTQGNPLYLSELAFEMKELRFHESGELVGDAQWTAQLIRHLPKTLEAALNERLRRLSAQARALLNTGAVLGKRWGVPLAVAVSRQRRLQLIQGAKELIRFNLLHEQEDDFQFRHDLIREYVLLQLPAAERKYLHELAAQSMEKSLEDSDANPAILAWHFSEAGLPGRAAHHWLIASKRSLHAYALKETKEFLTRAFQSINGAMQSRFASGTELHEMLREYWVQRAALHNFVGERELQRQAVDELERLANQQTDGKTRLAAHLHHAHWALKTSNLSEAICEAEKLRDLAVALAKPAYERAAYQELSMAYEHSGEYEKALALAEKYQSQDEVPTDYLWIFDYTGSIYAYLGQFDKALAYYQRKLELQKGSMDLYYEVELLTTLAIIYEHIGNYFASIEHLERILVLSNPLSDTFIEGRTLANLASSCWGAGDLEKSFEYFEQALRIFERVQHKRAQMVVKANLGTVLGDLGQHQQAIECFDAALPTIQSDGLKDLEIEVLWRKGIVLTRMKEHQAALSLSEQAVNKIEQGARLQNPIRAYLAHSHILAANDQPEQSKLYLQRAHDELMRQAAQIQDAKLREMFLENIRDHREIIAAWDTNNRSN